MGYGVGGGGLEGLTGQTTRLASRPTRGELVPSPRPPAEGTHGLSRGRKGLHLLMCHPNVSCGLKDPGVLCWVIEAFWIEEEKGGRAPGGPGHVHLYTFCFLAQKSQALLGPGSDREKE